VIVVVTVNGGVGAFVPTCRCRVVPKAPHHVNYFGCIVVLLLPVSSFFFIWQVPPRVDLGLKLSPAGSVFDVDFVELDRKIGRKSPVLQPLKANARRGGGALGAPFRRWLGGGWPFPPMCSILSPGGRHKARAENPCVLDFL